MKIRWWIGLVAAWLMLLPARPGFAWLDTGHRIVGQIVWDELTPAARAKAVEILKQHPRYREDLLAGLPAGADEAASGEYAFVMANTWPDTIRSPGNPMHTLYHHPAWHFIDIPYAIDGASAPATRPSAGPGPHDVVEALTMNVDRLSQSGVSPAERAVALCWVLHLGGDIHQPLHNCELFSPQFPKGDKGGNDFIVLRDPPYTDSLMNLHYLWDSLPGDYAAARPIDYLARGIEHDPGLSRAALKDELAIKDFAAWSRESYELAIHLAYLDGQLQGMAKGTPHDLDHPIPGVPRGYVARAEEAAFRQLALAGYRTADLLNTILDPRHH